MLNPLFHFHTLTNYSKKASCMNKEFLNKLTQCHQASKSFPSTFSICKVVNELLDVLFPAQSKKYYTSAEQIEISFDQVRLDFEAMVGGLELEKGADAKSLINELFDVQLPVIYDKLYEDVRALVAGDPAAIDEFEVMRTYPGFYAIAFYRLAHAILHLRIPYLPRVMSEYVHSKTGIDIHPGAQIAPGFCIDHGTGIVIGETSIIGRGVKLYQGVTLGALSVSKALASTKRHPTIEDNVVIYANATVLGGETNIGENSIIGGSVWLTRSLPANSTVYHKAQVKISEPNDLVKPTT